MVRQMPFTIRHFGTNSTIITYDSLHEEVYFLSPITYSALHRVKLCDAWANRQ